MNRLPAELKAEILSYTALHGYSSYFSLSTCRAFHAIQISPALLARAYTLDIPPTLRNASLFLAFFSGKDRLKSIKEARAAIEEYESCMSAAPPSLELARTAHMSYRLIERRYASRPKNPFIRDDSMRIFDLVPSFAFAIQGYGIPYRTCKDIADGTQSPDITGTAQQHLLAYMYDLFGPNLGSSFTQFTLMRDAFNRDIWLCINNKIDREVEAMLAGEAGVDIRVLDSVRATWEFNRCVTLKHNCCYENWVRAFRIVLGEFDWKTLLTRPGGCGMLNTAGRVGRASNSRSVHGRTNFGEAE